MARPKKNPEISTETPETNAQSPETQQERISIPQRAWCETCQAGHDLKNGRCTVCGTQVFNLDTGERIKKADK